MRKTIHFQKICPPGIICFNRWRYFHVVATVANHFKIHLETKRKLYLLLGAQNDRRPSDKKALTRQNLKFLFLIFFFVIYLNIFQNFSIYIFKTPKTFVVQEVIFKDIIQQFAPVLVIQIFRHTSTWNGKKKMWSELYSK